MENCTVLDIFCGIGGLTHGFVREKFQVAAGLDLDKSCQYAFEVNNKGAKFIAKSIDAPEVCDELASLYPRDHTKILVGCAPCQPFSSNNTKGIAADNWKLLYAFANVIESIQPDVISMENVTRLRTYKGGKIFSDFVERLEKQQYQITWYEVYCPDYGIPQQRTRLVLFASKFGEVSLVPKTHSPARYKTVRDSIGSLPALNAGDKHDQDNMHMSSSLSATNLDRIRASTPGGTWNDWEVNLRAKCHQKESGKSFPSVYGRMVWDEPSPTITTQFYGFGNGRFGHPEQDRAISLREGAILQTFPKSYKFVQPGKQFIFEHLGRQIGNAVPVKLGRIIASSIRNHLESHRNS
jgi:DNA (cytosine-5)-methyltransferase 1